MSLGLKGVINNSVLRSIACRHRASLLIIALFRCELNSDLIALFIDYALEAVAFQVPQQAATTSDWRRCSPRLWPIHIHNLPATCYRRISVDNSLYISSRIARVAKQGAQNQTTNETARIVATVTRVIITIGKIEATSITSVIAAEAVAIIVSSTSTVVIRVCTPIPAVVISVAAAVIVAAVAEIAIASAMVATVRGCRLADYQRADNRKAQQNSLQDHNIHLLLKNS
jgi:hypothetical protein